MERHLIDSHAHFGMLSEVEAFLKRAFENNIKKFVTVSTTAEDLEKNKMIAETNDPIFYSLGLHPHEAATFAKDLPHLTKYFSNGIPKKCVGVGETGLDYYYDNAPRDFQIQSLEAQAELAKSVGLPLIIHCRNAFEDFFSVIKNIGTGPVPGVLHCFTGTYEEAKRGIEAGFKISFSGIVTFKKATELQETCAKLPLSELLIETDCPFLAPEPFRGKPNEPAFLSQTALFLAQLKRVSLKDLTDALYENTMQVFKI